MSIPPFFRATNNKSALSEREFVEKAIAELLLHECIIEKLSLPLSLPLHYRYPLPLLQCVSKKNFTLRNLNYLQATVLT